MKGGAARPGGALVVVVLAVLALGVVATGLLYVSAQEALIAGGEESALRARLAAESVLRSALASWRSADHRDLPLGEPRTLPAFAPGPIARATVERLGGPLFLLRGEVENELGAVGGSAVLVRILELDELWTAFPAALNAAAFEVEGGESLVGFDPEADPSGVGRDCRNEVAPLLERIFGDRVRPPRLPTPQAPPLRLGPLAAHDLRELADHVAPSSITPAPVEGAAGCDGAVAGSWGDPRRPAGACGTYFPLIVSPGDLHLTGGVGQGILVVQGNLTISGGGAFAGAVLVEGTLHLTGGSHISGAALALDPERPSIIAEGSRITYDPCALLDAFTNAPALNRPFHPPGRGWIPWF